MKLSEIKKKGFYRSIDDNHFILEVLKLSDITEATCDNDLTQAKDSLFVDVWYHDKKPPYNHKQGVYQSNGSVYEINAVPTMFCEMEFVDDVDYDHRIQGEDGTVMIRSNKSTKELSN